MGRPRPPYAIEAPMLGLTAGELFVVVFVTITVVSASLWPRAGEAIALLLSGKRGDAPPPGAEGGAPEDNGEKAP